MSAVKGIRHAPQVKWQEIVITGNSPASTYFPPTFPPSPIPFQPALLRSHVTERQKNQKKQAAFRTPKTTKVNPFAFILFALSFACSACHAVPALSSCIPPPCSPCSGLQPPQFRRRVLSFRDALVEGEFAIHSIYLPSPPSPFLPSTLPDFSLSSLFLPDVWFSGWPSSQKRRANLSPFLESRWREAGKRGRVRTGTIFVLMSGVSFR